MTTVTMTVLMRVKVQFIPLALPQESLDNQIIWKEIGESVQLTEEEKLAIGFEELKDQTDSIVLGAAWKPMAEGLATESDIQLETAHARFLLNFLKSAKIFTSFDLVWAQPLRERLNKAV